MEIEDKRFWVGITVFATLFGAGIYIVFEHAAWGWIAMVAGLGGLIIGVFEKAGRIRANNAAWLVALVATWALFGYDIYDRHAAAPIANVDLKSVLKSWGYPGEECHGVVDGVLLKKWQQDYKVAIVCGFTDAVVDKYEDDRITISAAFSIFPGDITMSAPYSKPMHEQSQKTVKAMEKAFSNKEIAPGTIVAAPYDQWTDVILVPLDIDISTIHRLSDVIRHSGMVISKGTSISLSRYRP